MIDAVLGNLREYWMVHALLALYTVVLAHHAWSGNKKTKDLSDYYVGGRNMGGWVIDEPSRRPQRSSWAPGACT